MFGHCVYLVAYVFLTRMYNVYVPFGVSGRDRLILSFLFNRDSFILFSSFAMVSQKLGDRVRFCMTENRAVLIALECALTSTRHYGI